MTSYPTAIGTSTAESISLFDYDLAQELLGKITFGELAYWFVAGKQPTEGQRRVFEAVLVALADHGFTPTAIAARMTYYSAPDSLQGAVASGLLGGGSRFLGVTEDTARFLSGALENIEIPGTPEHWDNTARQVLGSYTAKRIPGFGHPVHKERDPRTPVLIKLARTEGVHGPHLELFEAIGRTHPEFIGKRLPMNGAGVAGAILADLGISAEIVRGVSLIARTAGLVGHIAEEQKMPVAPAIYSEVDRNATYVSGASGKAHSNGGFVDGNN